MARVGAPARQIRRASIEEGMNHECHFFIRQGRSFFYFVCFVYFVVMTVLPLSCAFVVQKWTFVYFVVLLPVLCRGYHPLPYGVEVSVSATRPPRKGLLPSGESLLRVAERQCCA